jgi:phage baseplate assembly protein V
MTGVTPQTGTVSAVDADSVKARVRLPECDNMRTNWLDVLQRNTQNNKDYWLPDVGEQVKVLLDENGEDGVILGAVYSDVDKPRSATKTFAARNTPMVQSSATTAPEYADYPGRYQPPGD